MGGTDIGKRRATREKQNGQSRDEFHRNPRTKIRPRGRSLPFTIHETTSKCLPRTRIWHGFRFYKAEQRQL
jgi:hypothetical protein